MEAALVSAAMESIEVYCAETAFVPHFELPYAKFSDRYPYIPLEDLPLRWHSVFHVDKPELWCLGWDLFQEQEVAVLEAGFLNTACLQVELMRAKTASDHELKSLSRCSKFV